jgi:hypothetical protein
MNHEPEQALATVWAWVDRQPRFGSAVLLSPAASVTLCAHVTWVWPTVSPSTIRAYLWAHTRVPVVGCRTRLLDDDQRAAFIDQVAAYAHGTATPLAQWKGRNHR